MASHNTGMPTFSNFILSLCLYFAQCQAITLPCQQCQDFQIFLSLCVSGYPMPSHNTAMPTMPRFSIFTLPVCLCITPCQAKTLACKHFFQISFSLCVYILLHANNAKIFKFYSPCVSLYYPMPSHNTGMPTFSNFTLSLSLSVWHLVCFYNLYF